MRASEIDAARRKRTARSRRLRRGWLSVPLAMGAALTLVELELWKPPVWGLFLLISAIPLTALVDSIVQGRRERTIGETRDDEIDRLKACVALAAEIHEYTQIDLTIIGVSVWGIHTPGRGMVGRPVAEPSLYRLTRFRVSAHPTPSDASWTRGRGVIGRCWRDEDVAFKDWTSLQDTYAGATSMSESRWSALSEERRWGFERSQFLSGIRKYAQVLAVPIKDEHGVFIGCLSVDIPTADPSLVPAVPAGVKLDRGSVRGAMTRAAQSLRSLV